MPKLTDTAIKRAKPRSTKYKKYDTDGLYIEITPKGSKRWRFRYKHGGKERLLSLGIYPGVSLRDARKARDDLKSLLKQGIDPSQHRKLEKLAQEESAERSFKPLCDRWRDKVKSKLSETSLSRDWRLIEKDLLPVLGTRPVSELGAPELLAALRKIEGRGSVYTAHRARELSGRIFRFGISIGWCTRDIAADLRGSLTEVRETPRAAVTTPAALSAILRMIDGYEGTYVVKCALKLAPLVMVRPGELRHAEWAEIDLSEALWRIPGKKMKLGRDHLVPLSRQAVQILSALCELTGHHRGWVFPGHRTPRRPMSENAVTAAMRRMGIPNSEMCGHGFRATASTLLHELGWNPDVIEVSQGRAIAGVRGTYNRSLYLSERRDMMQEWADYLDRLRLCSTPTALSAIA